MNKITKKREMKVLFYIKQDFYNGANFESSWNKLRKRNKIRKYPRNRGKRRWVKN
jgi:hypothetical protein